MLVAGAAVLPRSRASAARRRRGDTVNAGFFALLGGSLTFYVVTLYLGLHEGHLVVWHGLTPEQAEEATPLHAPLIMIAGIEMFAAFWFLLWLLLRSSRGAAQPLRAFVLVGLRRARGRDAAGPDPGVPGGERAARPRRRRGRRDREPARAAEHARRVDADPGRPLRCAARAGDGRRRAAAAAARPDRRPGRDGALLRGRDRVRRGRGAPDLARPRVRERGRGLRAVAGAGARPGRRRRPRRLRRARAVAAWRLTAASRVAGREAIRRAPAEFTGKIPARVRRRSPAALAGYELPMALMGFPGVGWIFAGFPVAGDDPAPRRARDRLGARPARVLALRQGAAARRRLEGRARLAAGDSAALVGAALPRTREAARAPASGPPPGKRRRTSAEAYRTRISVALGGIFLMLVSLPFVPAVAGIGSSSVRYTYQRAFTPRSPARSSARGAAR